MPAQAESAAAVPATERSNDAGASSTTSEQLERDQELDRQIEHALACPCIDDIKTGPCGQSFVGAFACFMRSQAKPQEVDCLEAFTSMQECMGKHPEAFSDIRQSMEAALDHSTGAAQQGKG
ncbi:hypothetical protein WJX73_003949 [Symbiochloris irregularis]|uniref:Mitochondrial intermembrane space import and assembly protein 40 n=1 Tax=Symbiochloris irregularis TaxID=706552 RepID=A0AAW1PUI0_9CHLO